MNFEHQGIPTHADQPPDNHDATEQSALDGSRVTENKSAVDARHEADTTTPERRLEPEDTYNPEEDFNDEKPSFARRVMGWLESSENDPAVEQELRDMTGWKKGFWINTLYFWDGAGYITTDQRKQKLEAIGFVESFPSEGEDGMDSESEPG